MTLSDEKDYLRGIIPLYVKGLLSDSEKQEVEKMLSKKPELREEVDKWKRLGDAYKRIECELPRPSNMAYAKITERIRKPDDRSFFERFMPSPAFSFGVILAEFLIIVALSVMTLSFSPEYRTLSAPSATIERPVRINVVFKEGVTETEIRNLLFKMDGKIVDGPFRSGLYVIAISSEKELEKSLGLIRNSGLAALAERAY